MIFKEKGRQEASPIPNSVCQDKPEFTSPVVALQVARLTRRCAISAAMAAIIAPLLHGEAS